MKKTKTNEPVIIEDVVWYKTKQDEDGRTIYEGIAEQTFYYQFLNERADDSINGQNNRKAIDDFLAYQKIYVFLLNSDILNKFSMEYTEIYGGAVFTFDVTRFSKVFDIEKYLTLAFADENMEEHVKAFCHPEENQRCDICGAVSLSRQISFGEGDDKKTFCLACHPLKDEIKEEIKKTYETNGIIKAVFQRIKIVNDASIIKIAEGKTADMLLDKFVEENRKVSPNPNPEIDNIKRILAEGGYDEFEVFPYDGDGIVLWNRRKMANLETFYSTVVLSEDGSEIVVLWNKAGICYINDDAIEFAKKLNERQR